MYSLNILPIASGVRGPAFPLGYGSGGHSELGVDLSGAGGHSGSGVGSERELPGVLVGSGVLPESAIGGVGGGANGDAAGGVIGGEYSGPSVGVVGGFDAGVAGGAGDISDVSTPVSDYAAPH
ncbi:uncharacterized protein LOC134770187 [Penaeus indicus]|uniref:uncharacterized protein LOC134770187 n=1 Tax=Penaeus indicus TaxID=29960 RepID=UPI00300D9599